VISGLWYPNQYKENKMRAWITYEIVTEESAIDGDAAERGYTDPYCWTYPQDFNMHGEEAKKFADDNALTFHEVMRWAMARGLWSGGNGTYYLEGSSDDWEETKDGDVGQISYAIHFDSMSKGSLARVEYLLGVDN
jgi:hypothetical protein